LIYLAPSLGFARDHGSAGKIIRKTIAFGD
jgi:hypothetical protein